MAVLIRRALEVVVERPCGDLAPHLYTAYVRGAEVDSQPYPRVYDVLVHRFAGVVASLDAGYGGRDERQPQVGVSRASARAAVNAPVVPE